MSEQEKITSEECLKLQNLRLQMENLDLKKAQVITIYQSQIEDLSAKYNLDASKDRLDLDSGSIVRG